HTHRCTALRATSSTTTRRTAPTTSTRAGTIPETTSAWTRSAPTTTTHTSECGTPRSDHGHRERQSAHVRCLRHRGGLAVEPHPRGRGPRQEEGARRRLAQVRRRLARALPARDGGG